MEFTENFFQEETRCNFVVPAMMKRAWAAQIEVLEIVADICERKNIQYFADWGTLLGAVRHRGFIPWDDDIDICLRREDYNELIRILPGELPEGFKLGGLYAESERLQEAAHWLHSKVLADGKQWDFDEYMKRLHGFPFNGVGIDIYPLDYMPYDKESVEAQKMILTYGMSILQNWDICMSNGKMEERLQYMEELCGVTIPRGNGTMNYLRRLLDSIVSLYREDEADEMTEYLQHLDRPAFHMKKEWYSEVVKLPFEHIEIPVPCRYREVLTAMFGDYMTPSRDGLAHDYPFYGKMLPGLEERIRATGFVGTVEEFCQRVSSGELPVKVI